MMVFTPAEEGGFTATIPEVPGAIGEGETIESARLNLLQGFRDLMAYRRERGRNELAEGATIELINL